MTLRVLALTHVFPNAAQPLAAPYFRRQFVALAKRCELSVMGLIPWFPGTRLLSRWSRIGQLAGAPASEVIDGLTVRHPRVLHVPKIGRWVSGAGYVASLLPVVAPLRHEIDVLFGTWAYPDGFASISLGKLLALPAVVQVIGSDINVEAHKPGPRRHLKLALPQADGMIAVSRQLADEVERLGAPRERIDVIPTGIDREVFRVRDRAQARAALSRDTEERLVVFVGRLEKEKGALDLLDAFDRVASRMPELRVVLIGRGSRSTDCEARARASRGRISVVAEIPHARIADWMAAADVIALPSWAEGTPNVLIEALASGRRVVASRVGGIPDLIDQPIFGELVAARDVPALAEALVRVAGASYDAEAVAASANLIDWDENAARVLSSLARAVSGGRRR